MLNTNIVPDFNRRVISPKTRNEVYKMMDSMPPHQWRQVKARSGISLRRKPYQFTVRDYGALLTEVGR